MSRGSKARRDAKAKKRIKEQNQERNKRLRKETIRIRTEEENRRAIDRMKMLKDRYGCSQYLNATYAPVYDPPERCMARIALMGAAKEVSIDQWQIGKPPSVIGNYKKDRNNYTRVNINSESESDSPGWRRSILREENRIIVPHQEDYVDPLARTMSGITDWCIYSPNPEYEEPEDLGTGVVEVGDGREQDATIPLRGVEAIIYHIIWIVALLCRIERKGIHWNDGLSKIRFDWGGMTCEWSLELAPDRQSINGRSWNGHTNLREIEIRIPEIRGMQEIIRKKAEADKLVAV